VARELQHGVAQLGWMQDAEWTAKWHEESRHPVERVGLRAEQHATWTFLEGAQVWRDTLASLGQRQLEQDLDGPTKLNARQRLQHVFNAVEVQRLRERRVAWLECQHAVQAEHPQVITQMTPADDVPAPAMVNHAIGVNRPFCHVLG